jgi:hypothetical protein
MAGIAQRYLVEGGKRELVAGEGLHDGIAHKLHIPKQQLQ